MKARASFIYLFLFPGDPKGALLTHESVVANAAAFMKSIEVSCHIPVLSEHSAVCSRMKQHVFSCSL